MASDISFVEYVATQISAAGYISYRKMFGEYLIYTDGKPSILICDNTAFIKILDEIKDLAADLETGLPYNGAKPHYILDNLDDSDFLVRLIMRIKDITPLPKSKKKAAQ